MKAAISAMRKNEMGSYKAARVFGVPQTTLERYVKGNKSPDAVIQTTIGRKPVFPSELEEDLKNYCIQMEERFFGLSRKDVRQFAYQLAVRNDIENPFSKEKQQAGKTWLRNFLRRNPELSVRTPQGLSFARANNFTPEAVSQFFDIFEPALDAIKNNPSRLFNCDETGITVVQHKHTKVIALKGKKQISALQAAERGSLITVVTCMSPSGHYIPPLLIFPRKNMKMELMNGAPLGSIYACHPSGWIQTDIFTEWFRHFLLHVKPTEEDPAVLVLDGHFTHTRNIELINLARENHVSIVCLPPHSTHKMQPLDVAFMGPLKTFYAQEIESWLRNNPGRVVTVYQISEILGKAYVRAATAEAAANGFRKTGLFPCNRQTFREHEFAVVEEQMNRPASVTSANDDPQEGTSKEIQGNISPQPSPPRFVVTRPTDISPLPTIRTQQGLRRSRAGSAQLITGSPYKNQLIESKDREVTPKQSGKAGRGNRGGSNPTSRRGKATGSKRKIIESSSESEADIPDSDDNEGSDDNDDAECIYCAGLFSDDHNGEDWIRCCKCTKWAHTTCADTMNARFVCDRCQS